MTLVSKFCTNVLRQLNTENSTDASILNLNKLINKENFLYLRHLNNTNIMKLRNMNYMTTKPLAIVVVEELFSLFRNFKIVLSFTSNTEFSVEDFLGSIMRHSDAVQIKKIVVDFQLSCFSFLFYWISIITGLNMCFTRTITFLPLNFYSVVVFCCISNTTKHKNSPKQFLVLISVKTEIKTIVVQKTLRFYN